MAMQLTRTTVGILAVLLAFGPRGNGTVPKHLQEHPSKDGVHVFTAREFVSILQRALEHGDRDQVVTMTRFPVQLGEVRETSDPEAFKRAYRETMLDQSSYIAGFQQIWNQSRTRVTLNESADHFGEQGEHYVFGCGEVWFDRTEDQQFKIVGFDISRFRGASMSIQDCYSVREFVARLQIAVAHDHRSEVATMLKYPLRYHGRRKTMTIRSSKELIRVYNSVFSARLRHVIAEQKLWNLDSQRGGVPIGYGNLWIYAPSRKGDFKVNSIFEPAVPNE
jgi:hypothetical protein